MVQGIIGQERIAATGRGNVQTHTEPLGENLHFIAAAGVDLLQSNDIGSRRRNNRQDSANPIPVTAKAADIIGHDAETGHSCLLLAMKRNRSPSL